MPQRGKIRVRQVTKHVARQKLAGKQLGFLTKIGSQAQAYLGIPRHFWQHRRQRK